MKSYFSSLFARETRPQMQTLSAAGGNSARDNLAPASVDRAQVRNDLEIQFFGLQRSGNHAVLAWIFQQFSRPVCFFNLVKPFEDPVLHWRYANLPNIVALPRGPVEGSPGAEERCRRRLQRLEEIRSSKKQLLAYSYENFPLAQLARRELIKDREALIGLSSRIERILLLRDFYNWIASRIRLFEVKGQQLPRSLEGLVSLWISYAREFVGETRHMDGESVTKISYNRWTKDHAYRSELLTGLGVLVRDVSIRHLPDTGGGSSFDGLAYADRPGEMPVDARWGYLLDDRFRELLPPILARRIEIDSYNEGIFGLRCPY